MHASNRAAQEAVSLDEFLSRLRKALIANSHAVNSSPPPLPQWAASCAQLLYSHKSIPPEPSINEPGKLYISCTSEPDAVMLVGKSKDQRPIKRKLKINTKRASCLVTITSEHVDFATGKCFTCTGVGQSFQSALDHYFTTSKLDKQYTYKTDSNVQQEGDAFLLPKVLRSKGHESWVEEIVKAVKELFRLVPEENHHALANVIENAMASLDQFMKENGNEKIVKFYDARLWLIVESVCKHFDPLTSEDGKQRKNLRDYLIAESCKKLMKEEDMIAGLDNYFQALNMHQEIMKHEGGKDLEEALKIIVEAYKQDKLYPEVEGHRDRIRNYYERCKKHQSKSAP